MDDETKVEKRGQVAKQLGILGNEISMLHQDLDDLTGKLGSILRFPENKDGDENKEAEEFVELATTLRKYTQSVAFAREKILDIGCRLEL